MKLEWLIARQLRERKKRVVQKTRIEARAPARPFIALLAASATLAMAMLAWASSSKQIEQLDPLVVPRAAHTATVLADGSVLITGGHDSAGIALAAAEIFDPKTHTSTLIGSLVTARTGHTATLLKDGRVLIAGGTNATDTLASAEIFEPLTPASGFRALPAQMGAARTRHTATLLNNGNVLIAGGDSIGSAEIFDPATESFSVTLLSMAEPRSGHTATLFSDETVLLAGGQTDSMESFSAADQTFTLEPHKMSSSRTGQEAIALSDTRLLFFGGDADNTIEEFNLSADTLTLKGSMNAPASTATLLANGKILVLRPDVAGIYVPDAADANSIFTAFDETLVPGSSMLQRRGNTATELPDDKRILVAGGVDAQNQVIGPAALFNPARIWTDKDDYQPDDSVLLNGSGWKPNEDVYLFAVDSETEQWTYESTVKADPNGEFAVNPYFIVELRHLDVTFDVTAVGALSAMTADVMFTDTSSQVAKIAFDRTGPTNFTSGGANGVLGVQLRNSSNSSEKLTSSAANNFVTINITSNSSTGRFDTTSGGSFTATSLTQTINSGSATNPNYPDFYYKDTALGSVTLTATVTAKGSGLSNLPLNTTATLAKTLLPGTALSVSPASGTFGGTVNLSATLTSGGSGVNGKSIAFTLNGVSVGSATTDASGVAMLNNASLSGINAGTYGTGVGASFAGDGSFTGSSGTASLTVAKADQTITFGALADKTYGDAPFTVSATASSGLAVTFSIASGPATISGNTVTITGAGAVTVRSSQAGGTNYNAAPNVDQSFTVAKQPATVTLKSLSQTYDGTPKAVTATTKPSNLNVAFTYNGSPTPPTEGGSYTAVGTIDDPNYAGSATDTLVISQDHQNIIFNPLPNKTYGDPPFTLTATASSGLSVSFSIVSGPATIVGNILTITGAETVTVRASQAGNNNYEAANDVDRSFIVSKATATVTLDSLNQTYNGAARVATATTTPPGLNVTFTYGGSPTPPINAESYTVVGTIDDPNYTGSATGTLLVARANANITVNGYTGQYDGNVHGAIGSATGVESPTPANLNSLLHLGSSFTDVPGGTAHWTFDGNGNYNSTSGDVEITISKSDATIVVTPYNITYDGELHMATGSATGAKGETLSGLDLSGTAHTNAGTYLLDAWSFTDVTGNYNNAGSTIIDIIAMANATVTVTPYSVTYDGLDHTATGSAKGVKNEALTGLDLSGTKHKNAGTYNGDAWSFTDVTGNYNDTSGTINDSIGQAKLTITAGTGTGVNFTKQFTKQYSDPITFVVQYAGFVNGETETVLGGTLTFNPTAATAQFLAPGSYPITPSGLTSGNYNICYVTGTLNETQEDARSTYTGAMFASTSSATSSTATVTLSATIQDITALTGDLAYDAYLGDIRKATVTFINRDTNTVIASNIPVGLVSSADTKTGTATYNWNVNIGSADSVPYTIGIIVNGYYTRNASTDDIVVTVSKAIPGMITGGGYLVVQNSAGLVPGGAGTKNNFGFNVKNGANGPKGNINTIIRNGGKVYQIKGNAMTSLTIRKATAPSATTPSTATFNGKANIQDITNPLAPISIDGNATLQVQMSDAGEPGANDKIAITVWNKSGGLWFSGNWDGTKTTEKILGGGNLVVR